MALDEELRLPDVGQVLSWCERSGQVPSKVWRDNTDSAHVEFFHLSQFWEGKANTDEAVALLRGAISLYGPEVEGRHYSFLTMLNETLRGVGRHVEAEQWSLKASSLPRSSSRTKIASPWPRRTWVRKVWAAGCAAEALHVWKVAYGKLPPPITRQNVFGSI